MILCETLWCKHKLSLFWDVLAITLQSNVFKYGIKMTENCDPYPWNHLFE